MEFKNIIVNSILVSLVMVCLFLFTAQFSIDNNTNTSLLSSESMQRLNSSLQSQLTSSTSTFNDSLQDYQAETRNPVLTALGFYFRSVIDAGTTFFTLTTDTFITITFMVQENLGIPPLVTGSLFLILIVLIILGVWSLLRAGR